MLKKPSPTMHPFLLLSTALLQLPGFAAAQTKCYYPEGNEATDYKYLPCNGVNTTYAQCCLLDDGDECLPNGLCYYGKRNYDYRAACSDKSWERCHDACPSYHQDSWINVKACSTDQFCCNEDIDNGNCCEEGGERFTLPEPSESPSSTSSDSPSSTSESSESESTTGAAGPSGANPQAPNPSDPPSPGENSGGGGLSDGAKGAIGGSIGGVAAIAIAAGLFFWLRRRGGRKGQAAELAAGEGNGAETKGYWGGAQQQNGGVQGAGQQQYWQPTPTEVEGSRPAVESGGSEVPRRYELGG